MSYNIVSNTRKTNMQPDDQNTEQPEQPEQNIPTGMISASRTIQPLSSEDDIRKEAEDISRRLPVQAETVYQTGTSVDPSGIEPDTTYSGSLITEPIHPCAHQQHVNPWDIEPVVRSTQLPQL